MTRPDLPEHVSGPIKQEERRFYGPHLILPDTCEFEVQYARCSSSIPTGHQHTALPLLVAIVPCSPGATLDKLRPIECSSVFLIYASTISVQYRLLALRRYRLLSCTGTAEQLFVPQVQYERDLRGLPVTHLSQARVFRRVAATL